MPDPYDPNDPLDVAIRQVTAEVVAAERARILTAVDEWEPDVWVHFVASDGINSMRAITAAELRVEVRALIESGEQP